MSDRYRFVDAEKACHSVVLLCHVLSVSRSGFYEWRSRAPSARAVENAGLTTRLEEAHRESRDGTVRLDFKWRSAAPRSRVWAASFG